MLPNNRVEDSPIPIEHRPVRPYTQKQKQAIDAWRLKNKQKYLELSRKYNKDYSKQYFI